MASLFDSLGPEWRAPDVIEAVRSMAEADATDRGAVFTRVEIVEAILDLSGYTADRPLSTYRLLEPSFGDGDFLVPAVSRLLASVRRSGQQPARSLTALRLAVRGVELSREHHARTTRRLVALLCDNGLSDTEAHSLCKTWLLCDDFLLCELGTEFDFVVGNPPYVRQERIPAALLSEYRARFNTLYDRADLYVPFYERALDLLKSDGTLGFICANRWLKNKYGGPLRNKIASGFHVTHFIDMEGVDAFHADVIAYPAITIIRRPALPGVSALPTRIAARGAASAMALGELSERLASPAANDDAVQQVMLGGYGDAPWLFDDEPRLALLRKIEARFPTIEQAGCKVGIGVATGCDRVFIGDFEALDIESARKLPLVMARDLVDGRIQWGGKGLVNPFETDGRLAPLAAYPKFAAYIDRHREAVAGRHVAARSGDRWYRTIDRVYAELVQRPKLLIPDIKGASTVVLDEGHYYPHHNLYFVTAEDWDIRALQTVLRSSISILTVASYCTRMAGGFLRFQAQYLRRIRVPRWQQVPLSLRSELVAASKSLNQNDIDAPVFALFGLTPAEQNLVRTEADAAQVTTARRKLRA